MAHDDFCWEVIGSDPSTGRIVWGVRCSVCKETASFAGADAMSRDRQEELRVEVAAKHSCKGRSAPKNR